jgi:hypothetical protein
MSFLGKRAVSLLFGFVALERRFCKAAAALVQHGILGPLCPGA